MKEIGIYKDRGWGKIGKPIKAKTSGKYYERTNIIAGYVNKKISFLRFLQYETIRSLGRTIFDKRSKAWTVCRYGQCFIP